MGSGRLLHAARLPLQPCLLGLVYFCLDACENSCIVYMLWTWPAWNSGLVTFTGWVTLLKYVSLANCLAVLGAALVVLLARWVSGRSRRKQQ